MTRWWARRERSTFALLTILTTCTPTFSARSPEAPPLPGPREVVPWSRSLPDSLPPVAIVIDDLGTSLDEARIFGTLPIDLTFAVLPGRASAPEVARLLRSLGRAVLVHVPMEPDRIDSLVPEEEFLEVALSREQIRGITERALARVPGAVGANNHMGSRFTRSPEALVPFFETLRERGLFFLDSRTTAETVAQEVARSLGLPALRRHVFLDHDPRPEALRHRLVDLAVAARTLGCAIAIGHPFPETLEALRRLAEDPAPPFRVVPLTSLVSAPCAAEPWPRQADLRWNPSGTMTRQR